VRVWHMIVTYLFVFNEYKIFCLISLIEEMNTIIIRTNKQKKKKRNTSASFVRKKERTNEYTIENNKCVRDRDWEWKEKVFYLCKYCILKLFVLGSVFTTTTLLCISRSFVLYTTHTHTFYSIAKIRIQWQKFRREIEQKKQTSLFLTWTRTTSSLIIFIIYTTIWWLKIIMKANIDI